MAKKYIGSFSPFDDGENTMSADVSLVGSHLQNICIEVEGYGVGASLILSPKGVRNLIAACTAALDECAAKPRS